MNEIQRAANQLFSDASRRVINVKFSLGGERNVSAEELAEQLNRAERQIRDQKTGPVDID